MGDNFCNECGGSDEHPPQHCQDCTLLDHLSSTKHGKGCQKCGFTGLASGPIFDRSLLKPCPSCGTTPKK